MELLFAIERFAIERFASDKKAEAEDRLCLFKLIRTPAHRPVLQYSGYSALAAAPFMRWLQVWQPRLLLRRRQALLDAR
jgi:hypothetical protein